MNTMRIPYVGKSLRNEGSVTVVLVALFGIYNKRPSILFVRRGSEVAYMKNAWSFIAGKMNNYNGDPVQQALVEIAGEVGLLPNQIEATMFFEAFEDIDQENNKTWIRNIVVASVDGENIPSDHPHPLGIWLDWEHTEAVWIPVEHVLMWLDGEVSKDTVSDTILFHENHTPDFEMNLTRLKPYLETILEENGNIVS